MVCMSVAHVWKSKDSFVGLFIFFHLCVGSWGGNQDQTQVIRLLHQVHLQAKQLHPSRI